MNIHISTALSRNPRFTLRSRGIPRGGSGCEQSRSTSCEAAVVAKPRARLCEPWVTRPRIFLSRGAAPDRVNHRQLKQCCTARREDGSPLRGSDRSLTVTQGSQSLALGLATTAASQLVNYRRFKVSLFSTTGKLRLVIRTDPLRFPIPIALGFLLVVLAANCAAQTISVSPSDVNAYSQGATSVLLTFGGLVNKRPAEATWCGALVPAAPDLGSKCDPATIFGRLPLRYDQSTLSGTNAFTDTMSITPEIARRAYLDAVNGKESTFFYVRRFVSTTGGADEYVPVTIRLSGNGAGVPLSLTEVKLTWGVGKPVLFVKTNEKLPRFEAEISYTGTGRLKGRWELVKPGEAPPELRDLLTEATLPLEDRGTQKRYTEISRFNIYLPPTGKVVLPGPEVWRVDESLNGLYLVLLRIEASDDGEGDTNLTSVGAGVGTVHGGAVAGFSLPTLRYYVSNGNIQLIPTSTGTTSTSASFTQLAPDERATLPLDQPVNFNWTLVDKAETYRLEVEDLQGHSLIAAILTSKTSNYRAPSWLKDKVGDAVARWRMVAFDQDGKQLAQTDWHSFRFARPSGL